MSFHLVSTGRDVPNDVNVVIEIPANTSPVKYEVSKDSAVLWVDRLLSTPMFYPANYGYVPHTLCEDGDPLDVMVLTPYPLIHGSVIRVRPIGMLGMTDEAGDDDKILAVPVNDITPIYDAIQNFDDLPAPDINGIEHFFAHYKDLCPGKWVKLKGWQDADAAKAGTLKSIERFNAAQKTQEA